MAFFIYTSKSSYLERMIFIRILVGVFFNLF